MNLKSLSNHCVHVKIDDEITIVALNIHSGEQHQIPLKIHFKTMLTTILDPEELIDDRKLGEGRIIWNCFLGNI